MSIIGLAAVLLIGAVAFVAQSQGLSRPDRLSTSVDDDPLHPTIYRLRVNGRQLVDQRSSGLNDGGGMPYKNLLQRSVEVDLMWIETLTGKSYAGTVSAPVKQLARYDAKRRHANLDLRLGQAGAMWLRTSDQRRLTLLRERKDDQITPEMQQWTLLDQTCAAALPPDDPRHIEMQAWVTDQITAEQTAKRAEFIANNPGYTAPDPCG